MVGIDRRIVVVVAFALGSGPRLSAALSSTPRPRPPPPAIVTSSYEKSSSSSSSSSSAAAAAAEVGGKRKIRRIAVVGAGAVGSYYGGRLWEAGGRRSRSRGGDVAVVDHDEDDDDDDDDEGVETTTVSFHLRGENYDHCTKHGIEVSSYHGDFNIPPSELSAYRTTEDMARSVLRARAATDDDNNYHGGEDVDVGGDEYFDWVVCALKSTSLDDVPKLIEPLLSPETRLLVIMNGLVEDDLVSALRRRRREILGLDGLGCKAIYGGMALICTNRLSPGMISHTYGGKLVCGVAYSADAEIRGGHDGDHCGWVDSDRRAISDLFRRASTVPFVFDPNLRRGRWWKNVWNLPFNGISVSMGGITVDRIVGDPGLRRLAYEVMDETIAIANADLRKHGCAEDELLGEEAKDEMMTLSDNMGPYKPSTMLDLHARKAMEVKYLFRKAVDRANDLGVDCPHLETIVCQIEAHQRYHNLY